MYANGESVARDDEQAVRWFRSAAEQGDADAQFNLSFMYLNGEGVPQDYEEAIRWFRAAAEQGLAPAQFYLGFMYDSGRGVPRDEIQAHMWLSLATSSLTGDLREEAVRGRDRVAEKMHPAEIVEAERLARRWKTQSSRSQ
jgi:TPR repeat protein